jgi:hypothetical protein
MKHFLPCVTHQFAGGIVDLRKVCRQTVFTYPGNGNCVSSVVKERAEFLFTFPQRFLKLLTTVGRFVILIIHIYKINSCAWKEQYNKVRQFSGEEKIASAMEVDAF